MFKSRRSPYDRVLGALVQWRLASGSRRDLSSDEAIYRGSDISRRDLLRSSGLMGMGLGLSACTSAAPDPDPAPAPQSSVSMADGPRVVVVGAGLAGLTAAYRLSQAGVPVQVFEARDRVGGRCWSSRGWVDDQIAEHGGEFIDTRHVHLIGMAQELGLTVDELYPDFSRDLVNFTWVDGAEVDRGQLLGPINEASRSLARIAQENGSYFAGQASRRAIAFDEMTEADWVTEMTGQSIDSPMGRVFSDIQADGFGLDATQLSAWNLIDWYATNFRGADSAYTIRGGNDQVPQRIVEVLPEGTVTLGSALESVRRTSGGRYELAFSDSSTPVSADYVILAVPFTTLQVVDLTGAGLSAQKRAAIDQLGMGTNSKILIQFDRQYRDFDRWSSFLRRADDPRFTTWEVQRHRPSEQHLLVDHLLQRRAGRLQLPHGSGPCGGTSRSRRLHAGGAG